MFAWPGATREAAGKAWYDLETFLHESLLNLLFVARESSSSRLCTFAPSDGPFAFFRDRRENFLVRFVAFGGAMVPTDTVFRPKSGCKLWYRKVRRFG